MRDLNSESKRLISGEVMGKEEIDRVEKITRPKIMLRIAELDKEPRIRILSDGSKLVTFKDGRQSQIFPDGTYVSQHDTCKIQINPDGSVIRELLNEKTFRTKPEGTHGFYKSEKNVDAIPFELCVLGSPKDL